MKIQTRECWTCKEDLIVSEENYHRDKSRSDGFNHQCKRCSSKKNKAWRSANAERNKEYGLIARYQMTTETFNQFMENHNWQCDICGRDTMLGIDHDHACCKGKHSCGKCIRGVLCRTCNSSLGYMKDNITNIERMVKYLKGELNV